MITIGLAVLIQLLKPIIKWRIKLSSTNNQPNSRMWCLNRILPSLKGLRSLGGLQIGFPSNGHKHSCIKSHRSPIRCGFESGDKGIDGLVLFS